MLRPARVLMRERKPWLRARRRLLGWKVRFTGMFSLVSWGSPGGSTQADPSGAPEWAQGKWTLKTATEQLYVVGVALGKLMALRRRPSNDTYETTLM